MLEIDLAVPLQFGARQTQALQQGDHSRQAQQPQSQLAQELDLQRVVDGGSVVEHQKKVAAWLEHPVNLGDGALRFGNVLQDSERIHRVESAVREVERPRVALQRNARH